MSYFFLCFVLLLQTSSNLCETISLINREDVSEQDKIDSLENATLLEGDIVPRKENLPIVGPNLYHGIESKSLKWPNGLINFKLDKRFYDDEIDTVLSVMRRIERVSCIRFRPYKAKYGLDYVKIIKGAGCFSSAGKQGGMQTLSLGRGCLNVGTIQHELLHAVGFFHHHMRSDRDKYLNIHFQNIKEEFRQQFNKLSKKQAKLLTPFDYQSIMIYGSKAFSKNNKPTMTAKGKNVLLTYPFQKNKLTKYDIIAINKLYKCTSRSRKKSSLIYFSEGADEGEDSEVDYPRIEDILEDVDEENTSEKPESENPKNEKPKNEKQITTGKPITHKPKDEAPVEPADLVKEKLLEEKLEEEKMERREKLTRDRMQKEKMEKEKMEKEKIEKEKMEKEKIEKEKIEKEKIEKEKIEKEKLKRREQLARERMLSEKLESERIQKAKIEKEKIEREKMEKEKMKKEKMEKEKIEKEKIEKEKLRGERDQLESRC